MLRFLLLRVLPRRLFPLLLVYEAWRLFRGFQKPKPRDSQGRPTSTDGRTTPSASDRTS